MQNKWIIQDNTMTTGNPPLPETTPKPLFTPGKGLWDVRIWIAPGLAFLLLNLLNTGAPRSPLWPAELLLYGLVITGIWANRKWQLAARIPLPRRAAPAAFLFLVWLFGMMYELSLTITGEGIGGVHPQTVPSFILAQGDYLAIALTAWLVIRFRHASFHEMFFLAGGLSLTEGLIFTGELSNLLLSPLFFLAPLVLAYYTLVYAAFTAGPLLLVDPGMLWNPTRRPEKRPVLMYWALGFVLGMGLRIFWGLVYSPLVTRLFNLPPGL